MRIPKLSAIVGVAALCLAAPVRAQTSAQFYAGKTVSVLSPFDGAGVYPSVARAIAAALPKYLPGNPRAVPQFMPGAGGVRMANYLYRVAPRDGTVIGIIYDSFVVSELLYTGQGADYKSAELVPLGTLNNGDNGVIVVRANSPVKTIEEAKKTAIVIAGSAPGTLNVTVPNSLNLLVGTKFHVVPGYPAMGNILIAMEQKEADGTLANWTNLRQLKPDWIRDGKLAYLVQTGAVRHPELNDTPLLTELTDKQPEKDTLLFLSRGAMVGKAFVTAPGVPADRVEFLRKTMADIMKDPYFVATMSKLQVDLAPRGPAALTEYIKETLATNPAIVGFVRDKLSAP